MVLFLMHQVRNYTPPPEINTSIKVSIIFHLHR